jgi:glycosyltransferase involved in cell wall biosynthesis
MKVAVVIPAHNEAEFLPKTLQSLIDQTLVPTQIIVVNDASTDSTQTVINNFSENYPFIKSVQTNAVSAHAPGSKVVQAFYKGFDLVKNDYNIICKFDADLIFPSNYIQRIVGIFENNKQCGIAGGFCYIKKNNEWSLESLTNPDHIRGALKAYRKECFEAIGGIKSEMGWDTVDELLAKYNGWAVITDESLHVKHLKPTGKVYSKSARYKQGEAFYRMRYGFLLTIIAATKLAFKKKKIHILFDSLNGYRIAKKKNLPFIVSEDEGKFIRAHRWKGIKSKLGLLS